MKIAVLSGKGGSGKSTVAASFIALAGEEINTHHSSQCIAIDCDVDASNLPLLFKHKKIYNEKFVSGHDISIDSLRCVGCGKCVEVCAFDAIKLKDGIKINPLLCEGCNLCVRLCPTKAISIQEIASSDIYISEFSYGRLIHGRLKPGDDNSGKMIARLREIADETEKVELQILDGPPGIGCPVLSTVTGMDKVVIVTEPTLSGLSDMRRIYEVASSYCKKIYVIINKADINRENCKTIEEFCRTNNIRLLGKIPFDKNIVKAQINGKTIVEYAPESEIVEFLRNALLEILYGE